MKEMQVYKRSLQNYYAVHTLKCVNLSATPPLCIFLYSNLTLLHSEVHHVFLSYIYNHLTENHIMTRWYQLNMATWLMDYMWIE